MTLSLSLDIGTRKVVGLLTEQGLRGTRIVAAEKLEHKTRAMFDGQIHDVPEVAAIVGRIVEKLQAKAGIPLREAAVAAAGRALRTFRGTAVRELNGLKELTAEEVFSLELEAVQQAQASLADELREQQQGALDYHYVGHSVTAYRLDGLGISSLVGQRGSLAELEVIGTFLPRGVVDSLMGVLQRVGLEMTALTLEPIAAINVVVPPTMRHLNLVLVDIGAGTSDIAITSKGTVTAYDMVPFAGDEVTEALSEHFLLDFAVGETVKRAVGKQEQISITDILGGKQTVPARKVVEACQPAVERLASQIAERVLKLNGGPPQAVILVGGGSLSPGLPQRLAHHLKLPENRVAVRGREAITSVTGGKSVLSGPDCVTPIGIAVTARDQSTLGFAYVTVGSRGVRLFNPARLTVADALLAAGIAIKDLQGRVGKGLTVTVNGELRLIRGTFPRPGQLLVNGEPATLETPVRHRDQVEYTPALDGAPARATVASVAGTQVRTLHIHVNNAPMVVEPELLVNGKPCKPEVELKDNDQVTIRNRATVGDLLQAAGYAEPDAMQVVRLTLFGQQRTVKRPRYRIFRNGQTVDPYASVGEGDHIMVEESPAPAIRDLNADLPAPAGVLRLQVNGQQVEFTRVAASLMKNDRLAGPDETVRDGDRIDLATGQETAPIFAELLVKLGIDPTPPQGATRLVMLLNGVPAEFTTPLKDGDHADIHWE